jgi:glycosyltransferase involved in cell wall biosynthesis
MRLLSIRLIVSLIVGITLVPLSSSYYEVLGEKSGLRRDLERRAEVLGQSLTGNVERDLEKDSVQDLQRIVQHFGNREHLSGLGIYGRQGDLQAVTPELASRLDTVSSVMSQALSENHGAGSSKRVGDASLHIYALPLHQHDEVIGGLAIVHDAGYMRAESLHRKPIVFLNRQHNHQEIQRYHREADVCLVTSLHDGMNLVAKEFMAARHDERGVLILSCFTGAAHELRDALQIKPYDIDQTAEAIRFALEMDPEEKELRMQRMRKTVREHNVCRWAGALIAELCELRLDASDENKEKPRATTAAWG